MDDTPVTFKRKGARPAQRARVADPDATVNNEAGSEAAAGSGDESPSAVAAKLKNKLKSRVKPKSRLSFGVDEVRGQNSCW
jgi:GC-rich sequence DNA-binding factor